MKSNLFLFAALFLLGMAKGVLADTNAGACSETQKDGVATTHVSMIGGKTINYTAKPGFLDITAADGKSRACLFYTSYVVKPRGNSPRPITFAFNGGPGSASLWLHMGFLGPKRVDMGPAGLKSAGNPFTLVNNDYSPLDVTDLVLIDPVATGYSAPDGNADGKAFFGATNDYTSIAAFITKYLADNQRFASPIFIMGESYGGIRGGLLAHHLQSDFGINLSGVIFISPWLSTATTNFNDPENYEPFYLYFPTYANTAWYHQKSARQYLNMEVAAVMNAAETFARGPLRDALDAGRDLDKDTMKKVATSYAEFTGLPVDYIISKRLRISDSQFFVGLLDQNQVIGRYDSRFVSKKLTSQDGQSANDPSDFAVVGPFNTGIQSYLAGELSFVSKIPYVQSANIPDWPFNSDAQEFGVMDDLAQALNDNHDLRIYVASGMYDLACPYETVRFNFQQMDADDEAMSRVTITKYPSGHMAYINPDALKQLKAEVAAFITK